METPRQNRIEFRVKHATRCVKIFFRVSCFCFCKNSLIFFSLVLWKNSKSILKNQKRGSTKGRSNQSKGDSVSRSLSSYGYGPAIQFLFINFFYISSTHARVQWTYRNCPGFAFHRCGLQLNISHVMKFK